MPAYLRVCATGECHVQIKAEIFHSYQRQFNHFTDDDKKEHLHFKSASSPNGLIDFAHQMTPFCHLYFI